MSGIFGNGPRNVSTRGQQGPPGRPGPTGESGTATLAEGMTPPIPATITATSRFFATHRALHGSTAIGVLQVVDVVPGTPGSFVVTSLRSSGVLESGDASSVDWMVIDNDS